MANHSPGFPCSQAALRVLEQLRSTDKTVDELATRLRLTANAVRNQLRRLRDANLVTTRGSRPGPSKPSVVYSITVEGEAHFSTLYLPVLTQFLRVAERRCSERQLVSFMTATGKSLADRYPKPGGTLKSRAQAGARLLKTFGALSEVRTRKGAVTLTAAGCPLAALTSENTVACRVIEGLLSEYLSTSAQSCCTVDPEPRCCFELRG
jgi:predicted ArsR family transcriptional regulator